MSDAVSAPSMPIRLLVTDDERILRTALAAILDLADDIEVVGQAADGDEAIALTATLAPDVVLLDLEMPGRDGIDTAVELHRADPALPIVMLTRHGRPGVLRRALAAGVLGFCDKSIDPDRLADVIRDARDGRRYIDAEVSRAAMMDDCPLSDRELDVLRATLRGGSVREIAAELFLAPGTTRNYLSSAMQKTSASTRFEAARLASEQGWL